MYSNCTVTFIILLISASTAFAQNRDYAKEYEDFRKRANKEYDDFRRRANAEYAEFMRRAWEKFQAVEGVPAPKLPDPVKPPVADPNRKPAAEPLPFDEVIPAPQPTPRPQIVEPLTPPVSPSVTPPKPSLPVPPKPTPTPTPTPTPANGEDDDSSEEEKPVKPDTPAAPHFDFSFYNTKCSVNIDRRFLFTLPDIAEKSVAGAWEKLSKTDFIPMVNECLALRDRTNLCDWGYLRLLKTMTESFFGRECNEAVVLQMFILTQSGYKVRIGSASGRLTLLVPSQQPIYGLSYLTIDGVKHYIPDKNLEKQSFRVFNREFAGERWLSLQVRTPALAVNPSAQRTLSSARYPDMRVAASVNQNLIDYFNDNLLHINWRFYVSASMSDDLKRAVYPALRSSISGKSETEAVDMLLNFVQTAFDYQTDRQQFGYERSLFADETFFYPYSDCEDRSILFAVLVRELMELEVVLLDYPGHIATAVRFSSAVPGDYLTIDNRTFTICDPTYLGARIGMAMDEFKQTKAKVIFID